MGLVRCGGGVRWNEPGQESIEGDIVPEVRELFVHAGWNVSAATVDLEKERTLTSSRDKDSWCKKVNDRIVEKYPDCEAIDITCCYMEGSSLTMYTPGNFDHEKAKHQFPKTLQIRTHPLHRARLTVLCLTLMSSQQKNLQTEPPSVPCRTIPGLEMSFRSHKKMQTLANHT